MLLVLSPHPDDLELSAGLLSYQAVKLGLPVVEIVMTDGAVGGIDPSVFNTDSHRVCRKREAVRAARCLGVRDVRFLNFPDGKLEEHVTDLISYLRYLIQLLRPKLICYPSAYDAHVDHQTTYRATEEALIMYGDAIKLQYCFWGEDHTQNVQLLEASGATAKLRAIQQYISQPINAYLKCFRSRDHSIGSLSVERYSTPMPELAISTLGVFGFEVNLCCWV